MTCHEEKEGEDRCGCYFLFNLGARWGWVANATPLQLYHRQ
jgi:hypothetical protein